MGLSVTVSGLVCVSKSWALSDVLFQELPRKSEIATGWTEVEEGREEGVRGQRQGGRKGRESGGRQETDDQACLLVHPLLSFPSQSSYCFVCFPQFFS